MLSGARKEQSCQGTVFCSRYVHEARSWVFHLRCFECQLLMNLLILDPTRRLVVSSLMILGGRGREQGGGEEEGRPELPTPDELAAAVDSARACSGLQGCRGLGGAGLRRRHWCISLGSFRWKGSIPWPTLGNWRDAATPPPSQSRTAAQFHGRPR